MRFKDNKTEKKVLTGSALNAQPQQELGVKVGARGAALHFRQNLRQRLAITHKYALQTD